MYDVLLGEFLFIVVLPSLPNVCFFTYTIYPWRNQKLYTEPNKLVQFYFNLTDTKKMCVFYKYSPFFRLTLHLLYPILDTNIVCEKNKKKTSAIDLRNKRIIHGLYRNVY